MVLGFWGQSNFLAASGRFLGKFAKIAVIFADILRSLGYWQNRGKFHNPDSK